MSFINLFIFGCIGSLLLCMGFLQLQRAGATLCCYAWAFSSCSERGLQRYCVVVHRLLIAVASLVVEHRLQTCGLQQYGTRAQQLWCTGLVATWHVGSSQTRARTHVPCIGRRILNHCATREALPYCFDEYCFAVQSGVREHNTFSSVFLSQDCFGYLGSFVSPYKF